MRKYPSVRVCACVMLHKHPIHKTNSPGLWFSLHKVKLRPVLILFLNGYLTRIVSQDISTQSALAAWSPGAAVVPSPGAAVVPDSLGTLKNEFRLVNSTCA